MASNKVDQLLQTIVSYDAKNQPYDMNVVREADNIVKFASGLRYLHITFNYDSATLMAAEGAIGQRIELVYYGIGPTVIQRIYAYVLWVMGN